MNSVSCFFLVLVGLEGLRAAEPELPDDEFQRKFAKASCEFALDLIKAATKDGEENVVVSPGSVSALLAVLQQGAGGRTAAQLEEVVHLSAGDSRRGYGQVIGSLRREKTNLTLEWGNRVFVAPGFDLKEDFLTTVKDSFNTTFEELDFEKISPVEAAAKINDWVKEATHDNIRDLVDASLLTKELTMVMANAIFFKSVWDSPFQKYKTRSDKFQVGQDSKVEVAFMRQAGRFAAGEDADLGIKWVELPFKDENFSMIFVLPMKRHGLAQVVEKISGVDLRHVISNKKTRRVKLVIPKFRLAKKTSLAETLKQLGLVDVFTNESNLSGITKGEAPLRLSQLFHQANVEIDEDGSTAAAATFEIVQTLSLEWFTDELYFKADHPFLFFIVDKTNEVPIFAGQVFNPVPSP